MTKSFGSPTASTRRSLLVRIALVVGLLLGATSGVSGGALAAPPGQAPLRCGDVVTSDVVLVADLLDCPDVGLVVGAPDITIDLNGHVIDGAATFTRYNCDIVNPGTDDEFVECGAEPCGEEGAEPCGPPHDFVDEYYQAVPGSAIENSGHDGVTVLDGSSTDYAEFTYHATGADRFSVRDINGDLEGGNGTGSGLGVGLQESALGFASGSHVVGTDVHHSTFEQNGAVSLTDGSHNLLVDNEGVGLFGSDHNTVRGTTGGVQVFDQSDDNVIENSRIRRTFKPLWVRDSDRNVIRGNSIVGSVEPIFLENAHDNVVENNSSQASYDGAYGIVLLAAHRNVVRANTISRAAIAKRFADNGGVLLCAADDNLVQANTITDQFVGIGVDNDVNCGADFGVSENNILRDNAIQRSRGAGELPEQTGDGITVGADALTTTLVGNTVRGNLHHGIDARSASTTLTSNVANLNGALGINAVPGVTDGGGNTARGNGDPRQCTVVTCS